VVAFLRRKKFCLAGLLGHKRIPEKEVKEGRLMNKMKDVEYAEAKEMFIVQSCSIKKTVKVGIKASRSSTDFNFSLHAYIHT
jgi:hypothetical protein